MNGSRKFRGRRWDQAYQQNAEKEKPETFITGQKGPRGQASIHNRTSWMVGPHIVEEVTRKHGKTSKKKRQEKRLVETERKKRACWRKCARGGAA